MFFVEWRKKVNRQECLWDIWDSRIPVQKSLYLKDDEIIYYNLDNFVAEPDKLKMLDLFCGAGGFAVGCSWAGFQSIFAVDHFAPAIKTWRRNHPNGIACLGNIKNLNPKEVKLLLEKKGIEHVDLITGGVPCQGFSISNRKHNDNDERNFLFIEYMEFVREFMPTCIILENVSGMRSTASGHFERAIKESMENLGYVVSINLVNAANYGVPQMRQRLIFVGIQKNSGISIPYIFPEGRYKEKFRTVGEAISDLPPLGNNESASNYACEPLNEYQKLMRGLGAIKDIKNLDCVYNHVAPNHTQQTIDKIASTLQGQPMYTKFKQRIRLRKDAPSPTQLAGGIRPQFQFGHPTQPRGLSIRERARIQSFPDSYIFEGGVVQERVQTGNAVPPLLIYNIVKPIADEIKSMKGE